MSTYFNSSTIRDLGQAIVNGDGFTFPFTVGSTTLASLTDVNIASVQNGDFLVYNSTVAKWGNLEAIFVTGQNKDVVAFQPGQAIARHPSGTGFILADANSLAHKSIGLASAGVNPGFSATVQTSGLLSLSDWTLIIGTVNLSPLTNYFLSTSSGQLGAAPNVALQVVQKIGCSVSPTVLLIDIAPEILL